MTKFIIEKEDVRAINMSNEVQFATKNFTVGRNNTIQPFDFYKISNLSNTQGVEVVMRSGTGLERIDLPDEMLKRIAQYIRDESGEPLKDFDCASFAHYVSGVPYEFGNFDPQKWNVHPLPDESNFKPGDIVMIVSTDNPSSFEANKIVHFAVYLNSGLYISKFGRTGKLIVASLEEMKKGFQGNYAYQVTLKDGAVPTYPLDSPEKVGK